MAVQKSGARKLVTRVLATGVLLSMYAFGVAATTGAMGVSSAYAQRGRGHGRGGGRGRGRGYGGGGNVGAGIALGVGAAVIGGAIAASAAQARQQEAINYCMQRYRSYDPQSMTYLSSDGYRRQCP